MLIENLCQTKRVRIGIQQATTEWGYATNLVVNGANCWAKGKRSTVCDFDLNEAQSAQVDFTSSWSKSYSIYSATIL